MKDFVSYEKLSKKKQRELNAKKRTLWQMSPTTKVVSDKTKYNRAKQKQESRYGY